MTEVSTPVVNEEAVQAAPVAPTPAESTQAPEVVSDIDQANAEVTKSLVESKETEGKAEEPEAKADGEVQPGETNEEEPQGKAEDRKQQLNAEIRDLVSQRNTLKAQVEQANAAVYQPATEQELLEQTNPETGENYNRLEAKLAAMEQAQEVERYNNQVAEAQLTLSTEAQAALKDFPMFDSESPEYNKEIAAQVDQLLGQNLVFDPNTNQIIGSNVSPYQLYKTIADASRASEVNGQVKGQQASNKMQSRVDSTSGAAPAKDTSDGFLKGLLGEK